MRVCYNAAGDTVGQQGEGATFKQGEGEREEMIEGCGWRRNVQWRGVAGDAMFNGGVWLGQWRGVAGDAMFK